MNNYLSVGDAARRLNMSPSQVLQHARSGRLNAVSVCGVTMVTAESVESLKETAVESRHGKKRRKY